MSKIHISKASKNVFKDLGFREPRYWQVTLTVCDVPEKGTPYRKRKEILRAVKEEITMKSPPDEPPYRIENSLSIRHVSIAEGDKPWHLK